MINLLNKRILAGSALFIIIFVLFFLFMDKSADAPQVLSTDPENGSEEISENKQISFNFNRELTEKEKGRVKVTFIPEVNFASTWLTNTYKIIPTNILTNNTKYTLKANYDNKEIYTLTFTTQTFNSEDIKKYGGLQSQDDFIFGSAQKDFFAKYPFYTSLPLRNPNYIVDFNPENEKFIITFITTDLTKEQKDLYTKEAIANIKKLGIKEPVKYYTQP